MIGKAQGQALGHKALGYVGKGALARMSCHLSAEATPLTSFRRCANAMKRCTVLGQWRHRYASLSFCTNIDGWLSGTAPSHFPAAAAAE